MEMDFISFWEMLEGGFEGKGQKRVAERSQKFTRGYSEHHYDDNERICEAVCVITKIANDLIRSGDEEKIRQAEAILTVLEDHRDLSYENNLPYAAQEDLTEEEIKERNMTFAELYL